MKAFILFIIVGMSIQAVCQDITEEIIKTNNSITLYDNSEFIILNKKESVEKRDYKILILRKYADDKKDIVLHYDKFTSIKNASVIHSDVSGKVIKKYKIKDFQDVYAGGSSEATDNRAKYLRIDYDQYPFQLEVSYEVSHDGSLFYPAWTPQDEEKQYIIAASFKIKDLQNSGVRYYSYNLDPPQVEENEGSTSYTWEINKLNSFEYESYSTGIKEFIPIVYTAPTEFEMDGYEGDMSSWKSFGQWINKLNSGKDNLTEEQLKHVKELVAGVNNDFEKIRIIYKYLQNNSRYVSIQLGIGGWQPFDASFVHEKKYGDCKALSFYTKTLLKAVGIKSYYTLIRAGTHQPDIEEDFPSAHFNHAILTVPVENDTIWLECTSQTNPFGYMGTFTSGRKALLIADDGGYLIKTKEYNSWDNIQFTKGEILLNKDGSASALIDRKYTGLEIGNDDFQYVFLKPKSEQDKWFYDELNWGNFSVKDYSLKQIKEGSVPETGFSAAIDFKNAASYSSNRLFYKPAVFTDIDYIKLNEENRTKNVYIRYPYQQQDSILIIPPSGFHIESNLNDETLETKFGSFSREIIEDEDGRFLYLRRFELKKGIYPAEEYAQFKEFIRNVQKLDRQKLVFLNRT